MNTYPAFQSKREKHIEHLGDHYDKKRSLYLIYASQFADFREAIQITKEILSQEQVWPDQCDYIIYKFIPLQKTTKNISKLVSSSKKQESKSPEYNRYLILASANYFYDQMERLITFVREYKKIANQTSAKKSKQKIINNSLRHLDGSYHDFIKELNNTVKVFE